MGTRSTYRVIETFKNDKGRKVQTPFFSLYVQYDGYPDGHPLDTAHWLSGGRVVNGIPYMEKEELIFNGAGCLAAQLVAKFKDGPGGAYIQPLKVRGNSWENYLYDIVVDFDTKDIKFIAYENHDKPKKFFEGTPLEFYEKYKDGGGD